MGDLPLLIFQNKDPLDSATTLASFKSPGGTLKPKPASPSPLPASPWQTTHSATKVLRPFCTNVGSATFGPTKVSAHFGASHGLSGLMPALKAFEPEAATKKTRPLRMINRNRNDFFSNMGKQIR